MNASRPTFAAAAIAYERARMAYLFGPAGLENEQAWTEPQTLTWDAYLAIPATSVEELDFRLIEALRHADENREPHLCGEVNDVRTQLLEGDLDLSSIAVLINAASIRYRRAGLCAEGLLAAARDARALARASAQRDA